MPRASNSPWTTSSGNCLPKFLISRHMQQSSWREKTWNLFSCSIKGSQALTVDLKPSAVRGTVINFSPLVWYERLLGHKILNHGRKSRVPVTPETKMVVLFGRSLMRAILLMATWTFKVVPSGMPHRGLDMSARYMRPMVASDEASRSELPAPSAKGLYGPLGCCGPARPATTAAYADPPSVGLSCRLPRQLVLSWNPAPSTCPRTDVGTQGDVWWAQSSHPSWRARQLLFCSQGTAEPQGGLGLAPGSTLSLHGRIFR